MTRKILLLLMLLLLADTASAQVDYDPRAPLYVVSPARVGTFGKYCAGAADRFLPAADRLLPGTSLDPCMFDDVDTCVRFARDLRRSIPNAVCRPNMRYRPSE